MGLGPGWLHLKLVRDRIGSQTELQAYTLGSPHICGVYHILKALSTTIGRTETNVVSTPCRQV